MAMTRSKSQVIFNYLPGQVFEHENGVIAHTVHVRESPARVNADLLLEALADQLESWRDGATSRAPGFPNPLRHRSKYAILEPDGEIYYDIWPLVLRCTRMTCGKVVEFVRSDDWRRASNPAICDKCGAHREQLPYLMAHSCGRLAPLATFPCPQHQMQHVYLEDTGSFETSQWRCRAPGCNGRSISGMRFRACSCKEPGGYMSMTVRQTGRFLTQTFPFVSFDRTALGRLRQSGAEAVVVGSYLGLVEDHERALDDLRRGGGGDPELWKIMEDALRAAGRSEDEIARERQRSLGDAAAAFEELRQLVPDDVVERVGQGQKARERTLIFQGAGNLRQWRLGEFRQAALDNGRHGAVARLEAALETLIEFGFADVFVVENFPVALVAYGYTRISSDPREVLLKAFPEMRRHRGKTPIYATNSHTEAIFFELDARRVIDWLVCNGWMTSPQTQPGVDETVAAKAAVLVAYDSDEQVKSAIDLLQHTIAHALIRNLGERAGFGEETMAEYLMPSLLTFGIYANVHQEFTLGALVSLVEHRLAAWLDATREGARTCAWDPVCGEHEGACASCLHLAFGCSERNRGLDRATLFGSPPAHTPVVAQGFWE